MPVEFEGVEDAPGREVLLEVLEKREDVGAGEEGGGCEVDEVKLKELYVKLEDVWKMEDKELNVLLELCSVPFKFEAEDSEKELEDATDPAELAALLDDAIDEGTITLWPDTSGVDEDEPKVDVTEGVELMLEDTPPTNGAEPRLETEELLEKRVVLTVTV